MREVFLEKKELSNIMNIYEHILNGIFEVDAPTSKAKMHAMNVKPIKHDNHQIFISVRFVWDLDRI